MKKKFCTTCKDRGFCSTPCIELNSYLKSIGIRSTYWIRNKYREVSFGNLTELEHGLEQKKTGRKSPINLSYYDKNSE